MLDLIDCPLPLFRLLGIFVLLRESYKYTFVVYKSNILVFEAATNNIKLLSLSRDY